MPDLHEHLDRLQRRLRHTQVLAAVSLVGLLLFVTVAARQKSDESLQVGELTADSISSGSFTLRDDEGRPRVAIRMGEDGGPFISLLDENTRSRLLVSIQEDQHPLIQMADADEAPKLNLFYNKNLGSALIMFGSAGRALYAVPTGAAPLIEFNDGDGGKTFSAP